MNIDDERFSFYTAPEDDINQLFTTKLQEGACAGHLRGVFSENGEIEMTWWEKNEELASPGFHAELRDLLETLQRNGPLRDFDSMRAYCDAHPQARMSDRQTFYAFRIDSSQYRYYLRLFPQESKHKFFVFCYQTDRMREDLPTPDFNSLYRKSTKKRPHERSERS